MLDYKFDPKATYLVACTYGPDSMALVDMLQKEGIKPVVCCVNYCLFESADKNYRKLGEYCKKHGLVFECFKATDLPENEKYNESEDFKLWARDVRFDFFHKIYDKYHAEALFLAHQQDDIIESYLLEKEGKEKAGKYGISPVTEMDGMLVVRPLLHWTHHDLVRYVTDNRIPYSPTSEVFEIEHTKNEIRKNIISNLNAIEREQIIDEMRMKKDDQIQMANDMRELIDNGEELEIRALLALPRDEFVTTLVHFVAQAPENISLKPEDVDAIRKFMLSKQINDVYHLAGNTYLIKQYDVVYLGDNFETLPYTYVLEAPGKMSNIHFDLDFTNGAEDRGIKAEDYPLTIRTAIPSDIYNYHGFLQNVLTAYSVWKMPTKIRYVWPIFVNKDGKIVYVPRYIRTDKEKHKSFLAIHLPKVAD